MRPLALALALIAAAPAQAFTAQNGLLVRPAADGFTVHWRGGRAGAADFWCAAGDYAIRHLHLSPATRIYRASPPPRRSGEAVRFTRDAAQATGRTGLAILGAEGGGVTAGHAQSLCAERRFWRR
jgi:hypothetical protein